jgi:hypothetical protein
MLSLIINQIPASQILENEKHMKELMHSSDGSSGGASGAQAPLLLEIQWSPPPPSPSYKFEEEEWGKEKLKEEE